jgi:hypothetical protein
MKRPTWITTASGRSFDLNEPDPFRITVEDIGEHLSKLCRFTGACRPFYSVAQHSCIVAKLLPERLRLAGLLHDAAEAYTGDWSSPMKVLVRELAPGLLEQIHKNIERAVEARFDLRLSAADHALIKHADLVALATEKRDLMPPDAAPGWFEATGVAEADLPPPLPNRILPWSIQTSERVFVTRVKLYTSNLTDELDEKTPVVLRSHA